MALLVPKRGRQEDTEQKRRILLCLTSGVREGIALTSRSLVIASSPRFCSNKIDDLYARCSVQEPNYAEKIVSSKF